MFMPQMFHVLLKPNWNILIKSKHKMEQIMQDSYTTIQDLETEMDLQ